MSTKINVLFICLIILLLGLTCFQFARRAFYRLSADFFHPYVQVVSSLEDLASREMVITKSKGALAAELEGARLESQRLAIENENLKSFEKENVQLREMLNLRKNPGLKYIFAEVTSRDPAQWYQRFSINKGDLDGVSEGDLVLSCVELPEKERTVTPGFCVVGRIFAVSKHAASAHTIVSEECRLSVHLLESGANGVIQGGGGRGGGVWARIRFLPRDLAYKPGETVLTSGISGMTPGALRVGTLSFEEQSDLRLVNKLFYEAKVKPAADLDRLRFVIVVSKRRSSLPP